MWNACCEEHRRERRLLSGHSRQMGRSVAAVCPSPGMTPIHCSKPWETLLNWKKQGHMSTKHLGAAVSDFSSAVSANCASQRLLGGSNRQLQTTGGANILMVKS